MSTHWDRAAKAFRADLAETVPTASLRALHAVRPWRHAAVVARQVLLLAVAVWVIATRDEAYLWLPASVAIGFVVFDCTVLVHEVVHEVVARRRDSRWHRWLGHLYALPSGLSFSQFRRWHLDHHDNLGTPDADPKRHSLSPHRATRVVKALYFTPLLFPIYFRAARREARAYAPALRRRIARERAAAIAFHLAVPAVLWVTLGLHQALALHLLPVFVVFPIAFALNRLGQHYDVDPGDPAHWGTLLAPSPLLWDRIFLWSNYHLEHHYFPRVPFYNLPRLRRLLRPFFERRGIRPRRYTGLLVDWFLRNRTPHTDWRRAPAIAPAPGESRPPAPADG